jgi:hypothetical protein
LLKRKRIENFGCPIVAKTEGDVIKLDTQSGLLAHTLYKCPTTGWHYFYATLDVWPAPGFEDTELGVLLEPEVAHGEAEVYAGVQA